MVRETVMVTWWMAIDTESVSDTGSSATVLAVTLGLVALGVALLGVTVWFWRLTRPDPDALGPLAVMSDREFARRGPIGQRRALDAARPGAVAMEAPVDDLEHEPVPDTIGDDLIVDDLMDNDLISDDLFDDDVPFDDDVLFDEDLIDGEPVVESDDDDSRGVPLRPIDPLLG